MGEMLMRKNSQDEEQEWDPSAAEFMVWCLGIIQTESGIATVGSGNWHGDGYNDGAGYEMSLLLSNNKIIHAEDLFLNLDRPRCSVPVVEEIMEGQAQFIQVEAENATVWGNKQIGGENNDDTELEKSQPSVNDRAIDPVGIYSI